MYLDTSVAVAIYTREPNSDEPEEILIQEQSFVSSELLLGEMKRALLAKEKSHAITHDLREAIWRKLEEHLANGTVQLVPLNGIVVCEAVEVMQQVYPHVLLRTLDALHVATYLSVDAGRLFTRDKRMIQAARALEIPLASD